MDISGIQSSGSVKISQNPFQAKETETQNGSFANVISGYLQNVDHTVKQASELSAQLAAGNIENIHEVTIAAQQSKVALELTVAVRDKAVEAYQEMMRMQI